MPLQEQLEQFRSRFMAACGTGKAPAIHSFLAELPEKDHVSAMELLIRLEIQFRLENGNHPVVADYANLGSAGVDIANRVIESLIKPTQTVTPSDVQGQTLIGSASKMSQHVPLTQSLVLDSFQKATDFGEISPVIGPYKILQKIAEGGMGIVFMAEQMQPVRRRVALKLIKAGLANKDVITRFEAERQALALMDHPNIAKVLDACTTNDGRPFFVMELVQGIPITEYCDKNRLAVEERLELFTQTCRAIQHAHQKGVVHRDIKPSNVLVTQHDGVPSVKVIDFGLAKALQAAARLTDKTLFTEFGQVLGTFQYMSPEQAEMNALDLDTRSDVYSLGVVLYELLTGSTPIDRLRLKEMALHGILQAIRQEEAPRPSMRLSSLGNSAVSISEQRRTDPRKLGMVLKGDLDWITIKALEKDRTRRYDSPAQMAEDVQRFLANEPIIARPPSLGYRTGKLVRKNKLAAASLSGALLLSSLAAVLGGIAWVKSDEKIQADRKRAAEDVTRANQEARKERLQREQEEKLRGQAENQRVLAEQKSREADNAAQAAKAARELALREAERAKSAEIQAKQSATALQLANAEVIQQRAAAEEEAKRARAAEQLAEKKRLEALAASEHAAAQAQQARESRDIAVQKEKAATEANELLRWQTYATTLQSAYAAWKSGRHLVGIQLLNGAPESLRGPEFHLLHRMLTESWNIILPKWQSTDEQPAFSANGKHVLTTNAAGKMSIIAIDGNVQLVEFEAPTFSPEDAEKTKPTAEGSFKRFVLDDKFVLLASCLSDHSRNKKASYLHLYSAQGPLVTSIRIGDDYIKGLVVDDKSRKAYFTLGEDRLISVELQPELRIIKTERSQEKISGPWLIGASSQLLTCRPANVTESNDSQPNAQGREYLSQIRNTSDLQVVHTIPDKFSWICTVGDATSASNQFVTGNNAGTIHLWSAVSIKSPLVTRSYSPSEFATIAPEANSNLKCNAGIQVLLGE